MRTKGDRKDVLRWILVSDGAVDIHSEIYFDVGFNVFPFPVKYRKIIRRFLYRYFCPLQRVLTICAPNGPASIGDAWIQEKKCAKSEMNHHSRCKFGPHCLLTHASFS
jgi:hypothetical protein